MSELRNLEPMELSRRLERQQRRYEVFLRGVSMGAAVVDPFMGGAFPGKTHFDWARALDSTDPLRAPLLAWLSYLIEARIHGPWMTHDSGLEWRDLHPVREPLDGAFSLAQMRAHALSGSSGTPEDWWRTRRRFEAELSAHRMQLWQRQGEVAERLGQDASHGPWDVLFEDETLRSMADDFLTSTRDAAAESGAGNWASFVESGLARTAPGAWPARVDPWTLRNMLGANELHRGLSIDPGALPKAVSPMSFVRAAGAVGRAVARELSATDVPFVVAENPAQPLRHEMSALMGLWTTSPVFFRKKLGADLTAAREIGRVIGSAVLAHARLEAARALVRMAANRGQTKVREEFIRVTHLLCGREPSAESALVLYRVADDAPARFLALLSAAAHERELMEEHDEDWYRNPRGQEQLREYLRTPAPAELPLKRAARGLRLLQRRSIQ